MEKNIPEVHRIPQALAHSKFSVSKFLLNIFPVQMSPVRDWGLKHTLCYLCMIAVNQFLIVKEIPPLKQKSPLGRTETIKTLIACDR